VLGPPSAVRVTRDKTLEEGLGYGGAGAPPSAVSVEGLGYGGAGAPPSAVSVEGLGYGGAGAPPSARWVWDGLTLTCPPFH
jgi:hypothetical protein